MKKLLFFFLAAFISLNVYAQRDTDHWFAPMVDRASSATQQALYFSTDSTTPFPITIYNNNVVIGTVTVSKGSPQTFSVPKAMIITTAQADLFTPKPMGIYCKGTSPYYVTLRIYSSAHAEIITSKGTAGIGNNFYVGSTPINYSSTITNFLTGIMATEDNTTVTVSGYNSSVQFSNGTNGFTTPTMTFSLNKGQSYIIDGMGNIPGNATGFIGAKITSNKPVCVTNGNMNGNFALGSFGGSDMILDQAVPVERLGKEFVTIKGNANIGTNMEGAIVIATEDNTAIYVNNNPTPLATINTGQFYRIMDTNYINQGNGHYNMYIRTTKNAYVYQILGGDPTDNATEGFNYIPPLNCYLPRKIDEIGKINQLPGNTNVPTKLNILTEAGATLTVNGNPLTAAQGPYPVSGTANWVSYSVQNVTGNVTVISNKAITAGITAGYSTAGYGGYFAGFSSLPLITKKNGDCYPGVTLEVNDGYDTYQWFLNGNPIAGATSNTYLPQSVGNYTVGVTVGSCQPVTTPVMNLQSCVTQTTLNPSICAAGRTFTPVFTNSSQTIVLGTVTVTQAPANGTATVNPTTGVVTYMPNAGYLGPDVFKYKFCGNNPDFPDCEEVTVNIQVVPFTTTPATLTACNVNGQGVFDLSTANVTTTTPVIKKYYPTLLDAQNGTNEILNYTTYLSATNEVYVKVTTNDGCVDIAKISLTLLPIPQVVDGQLRTCFIEGNESAGLFDLTSAVVSTVAPASKKYYPSLADAQNGTNEIMTPSAYTSTSTDVYVRVYSTNGCYNIAKINLIVTPPAYSNVLVDKIICVDEKTTLDAGPGYNSYQWSTGATTQSITNVGLGTYWVKLKKDNCITKQTVKVLKPEDPVITNVEISNNSVTIYVTGGTPPYKYSQDNVLWQDSNVFSNLKRGQNIFYVKDTYDCEPVLVEVTVPHIVNVITPNNDGYNDYLDYSELSYKKDLSFSIYDRYGNRLLLGDQKNKYRWDGRFNDRKVSTGTYWFTITWTENNAEKTPYKYSGWILVKNRE